MHAAHAAHAPRAGIQWRPWRVACLAGLAVLLLSVPAACGAPGGASTSLTTDTRSAQFATDAEKIAFLRRYVTLYSPVEATEFHIVYHANSGERAPGPADWDMRVALKVAPGDVLAWTSGLRDIDAAGADLSWSADLALGDQRWAHTSPPRVYERASGGVLVAAFVPEGIVLKRIWTE
jgi:hypothetical protein